ncbi:hypothetical protein NQ317_009633 [Molorchus minor]|uniref:Uncharacterized protein n=1 Tax=Molorchus minor TaxID=1323400 RepID=A0ABQ9IV17_9CUCU|nr:hypothetical protein NQ317_009633 [Molorchus minor]
MPHVTVYNVYSQFAINLLEKIIPIVMANSNMKSQFMVKIIIEWLSKTTRLLRTSSAAYPTLFLEVKYPKSNKEVKLGNELAPKDVSDIPEVLYEAEPGSFYSLIMTDPDAPSRKNPARREWHHWLLRLSIFLNRTFLRAKQSASTWDRLRLRAAGFIVTYFSFSNNRGKLTFDEPTHSNTDGKRGNFCTEKFKKKYNLKKPVAGNFFQAQFDETVPAIHKQLGF